MFRLLTAIRDARPDTRGEEFELSEAISAEVERVKNQILELCTDKFLRGRRPVGESPVHVAFLFGLHEFGMAMVEAAARSSENPDEIRRSLSLCSSSVQSVLL